MPEVRQAIKLGIPAVVLELIDRLALEKFVLLKLGKKTEFEHALHSG